MARRDSLKTVLRIRKLRERQRQADMVRSRERLEEARDDLVERTRAAQAAHVPLTTMTAVHLRALQISAEGALDQVRDAERVVADMTREMEEARQRWAEASARTKSVERLSERRNTDAAVVAARNSQRSLDELVQLLRGHGATPTGEQG